MRRCRRGDQHDGGMLQVEIVLGHALNIVRGAAQVARKFGVDEPGIFSDYRRGGECDCFFFIGVAAQDKSGEFLVFRFLEFPGLDRLSL